MHLVIPNYRIDETRILQDGQKTDIFKDEPITYRLTVKASLSVTPRIAKKDNNITLGVSLRGCSYGEILLGPLIFQFHQENHSADIWPHLALPHTVLKISHKPSHEHHIQYDVTQATVA